ncbi:MAG TPA: ATP-binding protein [Ktedonobacteraceae bacterium]|nr:ATP-binding protein [Ktedonobacteraceae bacterium]
MLGNGQHYAESPSNHTQPHIQGWTASGDEHSSLSGYPLAEELLSTKQKAERQPLEHISISEAAAPAPIPRIADSELESNRKVMLWISHLEAFFEAMSDGLTVYDQEGRLIYANAAARQTIVFPGWLDYLSLPLSSRASSLHLLEETGTPLPQEHWPLVRLLRGERIPGTQAEMVMLRTPDGRELLFSVSGFPLFGAGDFVVGAVIISKALRKRQPYKQQLISSTAETLLELLKPVIEELPCGVYIVQGEEARLVLANRAATEAWGTLWQPGQPLEEFLRSRGITYFREEGGPLPPEEQIALQAVRQGGKIEPRRIFIRHSDGNMRLLLTHALALHPRMFETSPHAKSSTTRPADSLAMVIVQDITALKEAEQLKLDIKAMKEAEQIKDNFIAAAAHELRSPLTALMGYAEMLHQQAVSSKSSDLAEWQIEALETIAHDTMRIVGLTNDLLDVSRLQARKLPLHCYNTNLVALALRVVTRLRDRTKRHTLVVESGDQHIAVNVDVQRIEQAITNLVNNAIKYSPDGGEVLLSMKEEAQAGMVILSVRDQGIGIPANQQAQIFSRFFRATNGTRLGLEGSGLGLYLSRELILLHGGQIWFESSEGLGSTFFVSLPLADGPTF